MNIHQKERITYSVFDEKVKNQKCTLYFNEMIKYDNVVNKCINVIS